MHIAFVGSGRMAQMLSRLLMEAGHTVVLSNSRGPETLTDLVGELGESSSAASVAEAVAAAEVVVLATPWGKTAEAVATVPDWSGKIVVDTTNNRQGPGPEGVVDLEGKASSEVVASLVPGARVVKAFNYTGIALMGAALGTSPAPENAILLAADDDDAAAVVSELISSIGGEAVRTGDLAEGSALHGATGPLSGVPMLTPEDARTRLAAARANS